MGPGLTPREDRSSPPHHRGLDHQAAEGREGKVLADVPGCDLPEGFGASIPGNGKAQLPTYGYLGPRDKFDRSITAFCDRYADQNEKDYQSFSEAIRSGRLEAVEGV
jgi:hypothetical protein